MASEEVFTLDGPTVLHRPASRTYEAAACLDHPEAGIRLAVIGGRLELGPRRHPPHPRHHHGASRMTNDLNTLRNLILERVGSDAFKDVGDCCAGYSQSLPLIAAGDRTYVQTPDGDLGIVTEEHGHQVIVVLDEHGNQLDAQPLPPLRPEAN